MLRKCIIFGLLIGLAISSGACQKRGQKLVLGGGPTGGTFQTVAEGLAGIFAKKSPQLRIQVRRSGGSFANLMAVEKGEFDLGLVYAGDAILAGAASSARLPEISRVRSLIRLYGAPAQLAVLDSSRIRLPSQLRGARIAVGNPGSGAALAAERYFTALGLWEKITPVYLGYTMALQELSNGRIEAVWELVGVPSESLSQTARNLSLRLLHLQAMARNSGFFETYPFYTPVTIAAGSYPGQSEAVATFQDTALMVGQESLEAVVVESLLEAIVAAAKNGDLGKIHPALAEFDSRRGGLDENFPLHQGAFDFWRRQKSGEQENPLDHP